jgi:hypothetical protein
MTILFQDPQSGYLKQREDCRCHDVCYERQNYQVFNVGNLWFTQEDTVINPDPTNLYVALIALSRLKPRFYVDLKLDNQHVEIPDLPNLTEQVNSLARRMHAQLNDGKAHSIFACLQGNNGNSLLPKRELAKFASQFRPDFPGKKTPVSCSTDLSVILAENSGSVQQCQTVSA